MTIFITLKCIAFYKILQNSWLLMKIGLSPSSKTKTKLTDFCPLFYKKKPSTKLLMITCAFQAQNQAFCLDYQRYIKKEFHFVPFCNELKQKRTQYRILSRKLEFLKTNLQNHVSRFDFIHLLHLISNFNGKKAHSWPQNFQPWFQNE